MTEYRLKAASGRGAYTILERVVLPGEWYCEGEGLFWSEPIQDKPREYWICIGWGRGLSEGK